MRLNASYSYLSAGVCKFRSRPVLRPHPLRPNFPVPAARVVAFAILIFRVPHPLLAKGARHNPNSGNLPVFSYSKLGENARGTGWCCL